MASAQDGPIAFVDVNVVPMDEERILRHQTVVAQGQRIAQVNKTTEVQVPQDAVRIACTGKYLMPGLADMHIHTWREADFLLFVANGVTTVRNMWGTRRHLAWRRRIANGELLGPTIFTAGPLVDGSPPIWNSSKVISTREEADREVAREKELGYDFVKVYNRLTPEAYGAIVASAKKLGMRVSGHVPYAVGLERVLEEGQNSIEHLTGYVDALQADDSPVRGASDRPSMLRGIEFVDESKIPRLVSATKDANVWNCVTLVVTQKLVSADDAERLLDDPRMRFVTPETVASWDPSTHFNLKVMTAADFGRMRKTDALRARLTRELHEAGAKILLGTDTANPFVIAGFSIHEELRNLVNAGLSPYEAIKAGTKDAAEFLNASSEFGTVAVGKRADLILLEGNPLEDVRRISTPSGVMVRGRWYPANQLRRMLDELVATYVVDGARLDGLFEPFPIEGAVQLRSSYLIKLTDALVGKERLTVQRSRTGGFLISSQALVNDPPRIDRRKMRLELGEDWSPRSLAFESRSSEGESKVRMDRRNGGLTMTVHPSEGTEFAIEKDEAGALLLAASHIASFLPVVRRLRSLEVGQTLELTASELETDPELDLVDVRLRMERKTDIEKRDETGRRRSLRVYAMTDTRGNASYTGTLTLDERDRMARFERVEQMGLARFDLVDQETDWT